MSNYQRVIPFGNQSIHDFNANSNVMNDFTSNVASLPKKGQSSIIGSFDVPAKYIDAGIYTISASSTIDSNLHNPYNVFNTKKTQIYDDIPFITLAVDWENNTSEPLYKRFPNSWCSAENYINDNEGYSKYAGGANTQMLNGKLIEGEWIQIKFPKPKAIAKYGVSEPYSRCHFAGSNDGIKWILLDSQDNTGSIGYDNKAKQLTYKYEYQTKQSIYNADNNKPVVIPIYYYIIHNETSYSYYRLIINKNVTLTVDVTLRVLDATGKSFFNKTLDSLKDPTLLYKNGNLTCKTAILNSLELYEKAVEPFSGLNINNIYNTRMPVFEGLASMDQEAKIISEINKFNALYSQYIQCNINTLTKENVCPNSKMTTLENDLKTVADEIKTQSTLANFNPDDLPKINGEFIKKSQYDASNNEIKSDYKTVLSLRHELDKKLQDLYNPEKSQVADYKKRFDSNTYTTVLLTTLATSILYYMFTKL